MTLKEALNDINSDDRDKQLAAIHHLPHCEGATASDDAFQALGQFKHHHDDGLKAAAEASFFALFRKTNSHAAFLVRPPAASPAL